MASEILHFRKACEQVANGLRNSLGLRTDCELIAKFACLAVLPASRPVFNCISFPPLFLCFSIDFWAC